MSIVADQGLHSIRPRRFGVQQIFGQHKAFADQSPKLFLNNSECELVDLSSNGAGCRLLSDNDQFMNVTDEVAIKFSQSNKIFTSRRGAVARIDHSQNRPFLGISFLDGLISPSALGMANAQAAVETNIALDVAEQTPVAYKEVCAELLSFLTEKISLIETELALFESEISDEQRGLIARELHDSSFDAWIALLEKVNSVVLEFHDDAKARGAIKRYTELLITPILIEGQCWRRSYEKPLGYPGDFEIMNYAYDGLPIGETTKAKFLHLIGLTAGRLIVFRMERLIGMLVDHASNNIKDKSDKYSVVSIGSGPAREIPFLAKNLTEKCSLDVTLVDSEPQAIQYSEKALAALQVETSFFFDVLNIEFQDILKKEHLHKISGSADVVYSSGMVDYLGALTAKRFVKRVFDALKPGGQIIIGNVSKKSTGAVWVMEYATDWALYFRTYEDMEAMADGLEDAKVEISEDVTKSVYFLNITKAL